MAFDVDGVLTDGALYLTDGGEEMKRFHTLDGLGLKLLAGAGIELALITGRSSRVVAKRAAELGIGASLPGRGRQARRARGACAAQLGLALSACGYMGDDLPDLPLLVRCGFAATVPDAPEAVRARAHYVSRRPGGDGAVREVCELILRREGRARRRRRQVSRVKARTNTLFSLALAAGLAALTLWLERMVQAPAVGQPNALEHDPDFIVERFTATQPRQDRTPGVARSPRSG